MFEKLRLKLKERQFYRDYERLTIHIYESALAANSFEEISDKVSML